MNVIIAYLDTMFSAYPQTPRMIEAKAELQGMMEDAYTSLIAEGRSENEAVGQVIRDFGNLSELAPALGIASDITTAQAPSHPAPEPAPRVHAANARPARPQHPPLTLDEAQSYAEVRRRARFRPALGVAMFVLSPAAIITLPVAQEAGTLPISQGAAAFLGILILLVLVAAGVMLFVSASRGTASFRRIEEGRFAASPEVAAWAERLADEHDRARGRALLIAIGLWILAPVPVIAFSLLLDGSDEQGLWSSLGVVLLLAMVAAGLALLLSQSWARSAAEKLGAGGASADGDEDERSIVGVIAAVYWPLLAAIFLAWGFIGNAWGIAWIVWPIGAVLFGAIAAGGNALESYRKRR
ncbi:permease prefix domain 1-containing protein [Leucobacter massiliensis]|uniref:Uncharacterized protein n=1 Tax=Leucobacter massiliensis TaxID=1686285 RepID=A0A2S9QQ50_9MICO|nr:permease prefix domain 1-containing protein [Leucobacter massiliensis]PRI11708.1 hypothetical protein B4915_04490 [Leucobacter massiliensis]